MHWYCLFIDEKPAAGWHRHRREAVRDAVMTGAAAASPDGRRLVWRETAHIQVCNNAGDRDRWTERANMPRVTI